MVHRIPLQFCYVLISGCRLHNPDRNCLLQFIGPLFFGELRVLCHTMALYSLGNALRNYDYSCQDVMQSLVL
jgi:hypothetical protein